MASYLVTFTINNHERRYASLVNSIRGFNSWIELSGSTYVIMTDFGPDEIFHHLAAYLDSDDQLYIMGLDGQFAGFGPDDTNSWLKQHFNQSSD